MISKRNAHPTKYKVRYNSEEKFGEEKNKLLEERSELTGEITSVLRDIGHLETELDRLSHDLSETGLLSDQDFSYPKFVVKPQHHAQFKNSEYDQEIPQSHTADKPMAP